MDWFLEQQIEGEPASNKLADAMATLIRPPSRASLRLRISFACLPIPEHAFLSSRFSSVSSATTSFRAADSDRSSLT